MQTDLTKTLEQLENENWGSPSYVSNLIIRCHELRKKPLKNFSVEDLRVMIGQDISLEILVPLAIEQLKQNILVEGGYYEGDLLQSVLNSNETYWQNHAHNWNLVKNLYEANQKLFDVEDTISNGIEKAFERFLEINPQ